MKNRHVILMWNGQKLYKLVIIGRTGRAHTYSRAAWSRHEYKLAGIVHDKTNWTDRLIDQFLAVGHTVYSEN